MKANAKIIAIGNSKGIRLPKRLLDELQITDTVELETRGREVVIRPVKDIHEGWEASAAAMHQHGDDSLLGGEIPPSSWDQEEWNW